MPLFRFSRSVKELIDAGKELTEIPKEISQISIDELLKALQIVTFDIFPQWKCPVSN